jgi:hypothetical protein
VDELEKEEHWHHDLVMKWRMRRLIVQEIDEEIIKEIKKEP